MDLLPSEEQNQVVDAAVSFLRHELPVERIHKVGETIALIDHGILARLAELGWFGIGLPEEHGGVGFGLREETLLFVELGRFLVSPAVLGSVLAARCAALGGDSELAAELIAGQKLVGVAIPASVEKPELGIQVNGDFYVFEGQQADFILMVDEQGAAIIDKQAISVFEKIPCMDEKIQMARISVDGLVSRAYLPASKDNMYLRGVLLTAAMQLGVAQATLERSVAYAKVREQYGKPIGSFQAIKHYCAEMAVKCESVMGMVYHAAIELDQPNTTYGVNARFDTLAAKVLASAAAQHNADTAVQIHGGMGFTQEMDIHLFVKRAHVHDMLFGGKRKQAHQLVALHGPVL